MKRPSVIKRVAKSAVDVPSWIGWEMVVSQTLYLKNTITSLFSTTPDTEEPPEEFTQATERLNLNEEDLKTRAQQYLVMTLIYLVSAILIFAYGIWHLFDDGYLGSAVALAIVIYLLAQAFSNHFWYFQIKHRRLGCTFRDWLKGTFTGG